MKSFFVVVNCFFMYIFQFKILIDNIEVWIKTPDCYFFEVSCRRSGNNFKPEDIPDRSLLRKM